MKDLIWGIIGLVVALWGTVMMLKLIRLKKGGKLVLAEIISVREKKKNAFVHTLRYEVDGEVLENDDRSGFNIPFKEGEKQLIYVDPNDKTRFEYEKEVGKNIPIYGVMIAAALIFSAKWLIGAIV